VSGEGLPLVMSATWLTHLEHQWCSLAWRPWLDIFTRDYKVLRHDSRGCGLSDRDASNLSFETWVRDLECVIEAANLQRFAMVGTCWGGPIAIEYAARHPERVSRLVLYGTYALGRMRRPDSPIDKEKGRVLLDLTRLGWGREHHEFVQVWASRFRPAGPRNICVPGPIKCAPPPQPRPLSNYFRSRGKRTYAKPRKRLDAPFSSYTPSAT
jgi:pimeloyl-ACP methyl ester carboxylesterase